MDRPSTHDDVPEPDAIEQEAEVVPGERREAAPLPAEASEADSLDQATELAEDEDEVR